MNEALRQLFYMRMRGGLRHRIGQLGTPRGAIFLVIVIALIWALRAAGASSPGDNLDIALLQDRDELRGYITTFMPLGLLSACVFTVFVATGPAVYFSQNEINFLYTGPFKRRDLVVYKFCTYFTGAIVSALIITLLVPPRASTGIAAFSGTLLTLLFIQLSSAALRTFSHAFDIERMIRARRLVVITALSCLCAVLLYFIVTTDSNILDLLAGFKQSWIGTIVLAPFVVFAEIFLAETIFPSLIGWVAIALAMNVALLVFIVALDAGASDRSLSENQKLSDRWMRINQGASLWASDKTTSQSVRRSPRFGGLGPVAWRQAINAVRNSGRVVMVFLGIAILAGPLLANIGQLKATSSTVGMLYFFIAFILPRSLVCDFRGELGRIEHYKALPISSWRICAGQLIVPVIATSVILLAVILGTLPFLDFTSATIMATLTIYILPFTLLLYGLENLMFLLFPSKLVPVGRVDFDFLGRTLIDFLLKTFLIFTTLGIARFAGIKAQQMTGDLGFSFGLASWLTLMLFSLLTIPLMALALRRFKISETIE